MGHTVDRCAKCHLLEILLIFCFVFCASDSHRCALNSEFSTKCPYTFLTGKRSSGVDASNSWRMLKGVESTKSSWHSAPNFMRASPLTHIVCVCECECSRNGGQHSLCSALFKLMKLRQKQSEPRWSNGKRSIAFFPRLGSFSLAFRLHIENREKKETTILLAD